MLQRLQSVEVWQYYYGNEQVDPSRFSTSVTLTLPIPSLCRREPYSFWGWGEDGEQFTNCSSAVQAKEPPIHSSCLNSWYTHFSTISKHKFWQNQWSLVYYVTSVTTLRRRSDHSSAEGTGVQEGKMPCNRLKIWPELQDSQPHRSVWPQWQQASGRSRQVFFQAVYIHSEVSADTQVLIRPVFEDIKTYVFVCLSGCLSVELYICLSVLIFIYLSVCIHSSICLSVSASVHLSIWCLYKSIQSSVSLCVSLCLCLSVCLFV